MDLEMLSTCHLRHTEQRWSTGISRKPLPALRSGSVKGTVWKWGSDKHHYQEKILYVSNND